MAAPSNNNNPNNTQLNHPNMSNNPQAKHTHTTPLTERNLSIYNDTVVGSRQRPDGTSFVVRSGPDADSSLIP